MEESKHTDVCRMFWISESLVLCPDCVTSASSESYMRSDVFNKMLLNTLTCSHVGPADNCALPTFWKVCCNTRRPSLTELPTAQRQSSNALFQNTKRTWTSVHRVKISSARLCCAARNTLPIIALSRGTTTYRYDHVTTSAVHFGLRDETSGLNRWVVRAQLLRCWQLLS